MSDPVQVVTQFLATASEGRDGFTKAVRGWFTPQTVWENVGLSTTVGPDEALGLMQNMGGAMGVDSLRIENRAVAAQGRKVLTERVDYMLGASGETKMEVPCMGVFEVDADGKITRWTDYFDSAAFKPPAA
jgi:limonene-1,2-epoxide hydrolase